jgi:hypothetical protein
VTIDIAGLDDAGIKQELVERMTRDIAAMTAALESRAGHERIEAASRAHAAENTEFLRSLIALRGWPTSSRFGEYGQAAAGWLLAFSARIDPGFQDRCLLLLARLLETGEVKGHFYAFTVDRVLMTQGRCQRYGTQLPADRGLLRPGEVEDPPRLNTRRARIGLEPLELAPPARRRRKGQGTHPGPRGYGKPKGRERP